MKSLALKSSRDVYFVKQFHVVSCLDFVFGFRVHDFFGRAETILLHIDWDSTFNFKSRLVDRKASNAPIRIGECPA